MGGEFFTGNEGARDRNGQLLWGAAITREILEQSVTVGAVVAVALPTTPLNARKFMVIQNNSANIVYIGSSTVTSARGYKLLPNAGILLNVEDNVDIYAIASGAGSDVRILEGA